uniref:Divergent protein kinase domain 2A n=1 Tax=Eptatretus burgeri TaxID=7764 RepID=A0A8C4QI03_EPTBU
MALWCCPLYRRFLRAPCGCYTFLVIVTVVWALLSMIFGFNNSLKDADFIGLTACPACLGTSWCHQFLSGQLKLNFWWRLRLLNFLNHKQVFFGHFRDDRKGWVSVVFKRLASADEILVLDQRLCHEAGLPGHCNVSHAVRFFEKVIQLNTEVASGWSDVLRCPSRLLLQQLAKRHGEDSGVSGLAHFTYTLRLNPEPVILQAFPKSEGWPFPQYLGACGRFIAVVNAGPGLWSFVGAPWYRRAALARDLLNLAEKLTWSDLHFSLYMLDVTFDNFAVDPVDGHPVLVDAENVLVVDREHVREAKPEGWNEWYESDSYNENDVPCEACLTYSYTSLCNHLYHDHNFYAICHNLLGAGARWRGWQGGLLQGAPPYITADGRLITLLQQCEQPTNRFKAPLNVKPKIGCTVDPSPTEAHTS